MTDTPELDFTGERFTPECVREIRYEHWHRYAFASLFSGGREVLDAACGEGYGSAQLARNARAVLGADLDPAAVAHANARYASKQPNLRFMQADATAAEWPARFDLIVSFETLEHVAEQRRMIAGFARALRPGGLLLISTPDKAIYSDRTGYRNEHHVRELYREEFDALLAEQFPARRLWGQKLMFSSALWPLDQPARSVVMQQLHEDETLQPGFPEDPVYLLALCAADAATLAAVDARVSLFGDLEESVYRHYHHEIRKNMQAGAVLQQLEAERDALRADNARLRAELDAQRTRPGPP